MRIQANLTIIIFQNDNVTIRMYYDLSITLKYRQSSFITERVTIQIFENLNYSRLKEGISEGRRREKKNQFNLHDGGVQTFKAIEM